jgi:two-component system, chemotaxis family, chemotaxis protein CheY
MRVLIIDDSAAMRRMLTAYVGELKAESVQAGDGQEALEVLEAQGPFDVALVDWDMPRLNGIQFLLRVRGNSKYRHMKLVMVTAHVNFEDLEQALECGADDYIMKPVTVDMITDKLRMLGLAA